jgi:hypothetical protein
MAVFDQQMRKRGVKTGRFDKGIDKENTKELKNIVKKYEWPTISMVGKKASFNAWLLVQHADLDINFQKRVLKLMNDVFKKNPKDVEKRNIAYLTDRVLVREKKKQMYGTQFYRKGNKLVPRPIVDMKDLDKRRNAINPEPFSTYKKQMETRNKKLDK